MVQPAFLAHVGDEQIQRVVAVKIAPGCSLAEALVGDAGRLRDITERAVAFIVVKATKVARVDLGMLATVERCGDARYAPQTNRSSRPSLSKSPKAPG